MATLILRWGLKVVDERKNWDPYILVEKEKVFSSSKKTISGKTVFMENHEKALFDQWKAERDCTNMNRPKQECDDTSKDKTTLHSESSLSKFSES